MYGNVIQYNDAHLFIQRPITDFTVEYECDTRIQKNRIDDIKVPVMSPATKIVRIFVSLGAIVGMMSSGTRTENLSDPNPNYDYRVRGF